MMREKIFRLHRHKSSSSASSSVGSTDAFGQKFDFIFSNIHAIQVPKGWDKLSLSLISSESGKTVCRTGKVPVKSGTCRWTETLSESVWISDVDSSKEVEKSLFKFLVATGSSKSGILGEATLNLAAFLSSESPVLVSLPLKKCNYGTILQVEIRCLTPKTNLRDKKWKDMNAHKDENTDHDSVENQSEISDSPTVQSSESFSSNYVGNSSSPGELGSRETSFSASVSRYSFDSRDDSMGRQSFSSQSDQNRGNSVIVRQDSNESHDSSSVKSVQSLQSPLARQDQGKKQIEESDFMQEFRKLSSGTFEQADDAKVQEVEAEARMWEQNARKLAVDVERITRELSDQNLNTTNLKMDLARSNSEYQKLSQENEHLKFLLEESSVKQNAGENSELHEIAIQKELEDEIRFLKEENENLCLRLEKTQESNIELISVLQEMEETMAKQTLVTESLSANKLDFNIYTNCREVNFDDQVSAKSLKDCDSNASICEMSVADNHEKIPRENNCISELELLNLQELEHTLKGDILVLESTLQEKITEVEIEEDVKNRVLKEFFVECNHRLAAKEQIIMHLEAALPSVLSENRGRVDAHEEIRRLKQKVWELERDCNELTEENLQLLFELKELRNNITKGTNECLVSLSHEVSVNSCHDESTSEVSKLELCMQQPTDEKNLDSDDEVNFNVQSQSKEYKSTIGEPDADSLKKESKIEIPSHHKIDVSDNKIDESRMMELEYNQTELVKHLSDLQEENVYLSQRVSGLEAQLRYLTDETESSRLELQNSESKVMILESQIRRLEGEIESRKLDMKQKLFEMQKQCSEAQDEGAALSKLNIRLQATTESVIEEYNSLQMFNGELREQKLKLQDSVLGLEAEARKFRHSHCKCAQNNTTLEVKCSLLKEETEPGTEAENCCGYEGNIEQESTPDREIIERPDWENRVVLAANKENVLIMFEDMMNDEWKCKSIINELESKVRVSELERLQLAEENSLLHLQLQKVPELQNEFIALRISHKEMKSQTQLLEASFKSASGDYEELKHEKKLMVQKISSMEKAVSEAEDCRRKKNAMEEKILRLEGDLIAGDALCIQNAKIKNELNWTKIANSQLLVKVKYLEDLQKQDSRSRRSQVCVMDCESRIHLLENELAKSLEANDTYKSQLERAQAVDSGKSESAEPEHKISLLEGELQEIRERYFQISLRYAEVEAQREQLVMKLKALNI